MFCFYKLLRFVGVITNVKIIESVYFETWNTIIQLKLPQTIKHKIVCVNKHKFIFMNFLFGA